MTFIPESCRGTCHAATSKWGDPNSGNGEPCTCLAARRRQASAVPYRPDPSWQTPASPLPAPASSPETFRESFATHPEPLRSTLLRMGAAFLDLDDPDVYARACRLADEVRP